MGERKTRVTLLLTKSRQRVERALAGRAVESGDLLLLLTIKSKA